MIVDNQEYIPVLRELVQEGKEVTLTIAGNSMSPFMVHGRDRVLIARPEGKWHKGDIAFFQRRTSEFILHRICRVDGDGSCYFVGDGQIQIEGPVFPEQIFGKIIAVERKGRWEKPGTFWWEFFEHIWLNIIPLRPFCVRIYSLLTGQRGNGGGEEGQADIWNH